SCADGINKLGHHVLAVDFAAVSEPKNENAHSLVVDIANHAIVADPVTPKVAERAAQCLAQTARVALHSNAVVEKIQDSPGDRFVQLLELFPGGVRVLNRPGQDRVSPLRWNE